jgi:LPS-assembly protein
MTSAFRDYALTGKDIETIRHEIKPEVVYDYVPSADQTDLPDFAEKIEEKNALTAALTSTLTAKVKGKDGAKNYLEILRLKLSQSYDIKEERRDDGSGAPRRPFGPFEMELDIKPVQYFAFYARNRLNVNSGAWEKADYDLNISDSRGDSASVGYRYTRDLLNEINISLKAVLTKSLDLSYVLKRNEFDHNNLRNSFGFNFKRQCWSVGLSYADDINDRSLMLSFSLNGLGQVGEK